MAASMSLHQKKEDFKEEFLTCSICTEPYDNDKHKAKCLPCLHTYCQSCLERIAGTQPKLECPNCRKLVKLPGGTVDSLPHNFLVENLKEYHDIFNQTVSCGGCESLNAISFCHNCELFQCQKCVDCHRHYGPLRNHELSTMAELQEKKYNPATFHQRPVQAGAIHSPQQQHLQQVPFQSGSSFQSPAPSSHAQSPFPAANQLTQQSLQRFPVMQQSQTPFYPMLYQTPPWAPGQVDPQQCTIKLKLKVRHSKAIIQSVAMNGQKMTTGGARVEATQDGHSLKVQDKNNGTYTFRYSSYGGDYLNVKINGTKMKGSPIKI